MKEIKFVDRNSLIFAVVFFIGSALLFYSQTNQLTGSLAIAALAAAFAWIAWVLTRWIFLALTK
jgi:hypothetical protein